MSGNLLRGKLTRRLLWLAAGSLALVAALAAGVYWKFGADVFPRVPAGHVAILIHKSGPLPPPGTIIAPRVAAGEEPFRGVQEDVLPPGWHMEYGPLEWAWEIVPQTVVPPDKVGVLVRLFGEELPPGEVLADASPAGAPQKGVLQKTLEPGSHLLNRFAYDVLLFERIEISSGQVGVVTRQVGALPAQPDEFLSAPGERGVQRETLPPGSHYVNPFVLAVTPVSRQSQRLDLATGRGVRFATSDGFEIGLDGTVEWSLPEQAVPAVFVRFGTTEETEHKLLMPAARATSQIRGAQQPAREFIAGSTRLSFQKDFESALKDVIEVEGPRVASVLISNIIPPDEIAAPIKERENSENLRSQYVEQMRENEAKALLVVKTEEENRPAKLAEAQTTSIKLTSAAEIDRQARLAEARHALEQIDLKRSAAGTQADTMVAQARSRAILVLEKARADAAVLKERVAAHGGGAAYARAVLLDRLAPRYASIRDGCDGPLANAFRALLAPAAGDSTPEDSR